MKNKDRENESRGGGTEKREKGSNSEKQDTPIVR